MNAAIEVEGVTKRFAGAARLGKRMGDPVPVSR